MREITTVIIGDGDGDHYRYTAHSISVSLLQVVACTEKLDIFSPQRGAALGEWDDVIEVKFICGSADDTFPTIAFPDCQLHGGWDEPLPIVEYWSETREMENHLRQRSA